MRRWILSIVTILLLTIMPAAALAEGLILPYARSGKSGLIDDRGNIVLSLKYDEVVPVPIVDESGAATGQVGKLFRVARGSGASRRYALLSATGKPLTDFSFTRITQIGNRIWCEGGKNSQLLSANGKLIAKPGYDSAVYSQGILSVNHSGGGSFIDKNGVRLGDGAFDAVGPFSGGLASVTVGGLVGFVDTSLTFVLEPQWEVGTVGAFSESGYAPARKDGLWGLIDRDGKWAVEPRWTEISGITGDRFTATLEGNMALLDGKGKALTGYVYGDIYAVGYGYFQASGQLIDGSGTPVQSPGRATLTPIARDRFVAYADDRRGIVNEKGSWLTGEGITEVMAYGQSGYVRYMSRASEGYGLLDMDGNVVLAAEYDQLEPSMGEYWTARKGEVSGILSAKSGDWVLELQQ